MKLFQGIIIWLIEAISVSSCLVQNLRQWTPPEAGENALIAAEKEMKSSRGLSISAVWLLYQWALPTYRGDEELGASVPHCDTRGKHVIVTGVFEKRFTCRWTESPQFSVLVSVCFVQRVEALVTDLNVKPQLMTCVSYRSYTIHFCIMDSSLFVF